jgi:hypothetical protein
MVSLDELSDDSLADDAAEPRVRFLFRPKTPRIVEAMGLELIGKKRLGDSLGQRYGNTKQNFRKRVQETTNASNIIDIFLEKK